VGERATGYMCSYAARCVHYSSYFPLSSLSLSKEKEPEYSWVSRHTWQSWRERYKKNAGRLDPVIAQIVEDRKPTLGEKGQYGYVRKPEDKPSSRGRSRRRKATSAETVNDEEVHAGGPQPGPSQPGLSQPELSQHIPPPPPPPHPMPPPHSMIPIPPERFTAHGMPMLPPHMYPPPHMMHPDDLARLGGGPMDPLVHLPPPPMPGPPPLQRLPSTESDPEWAIRDGNQTQPNWAKRRAPEDQLTGESEGEGEPFKRQKTCVGSSTL
jgi:hypothetical protein